MNDISDAIQNFIYVFAYTYLFANELLIIIICYNYERLYVKIKNKLLTMGKITLNSSSLNKFKEIM